MEKEVRKNKPRFRGKLLLFVCAAALFGGLGLGAGLGFGGGGFPGLPSSDQKESQTEGRTNVKETASAYTEPEMTPELSDFVIEINEEEIVFRGQTHSIESLREALLKAYHEGEVYELWDDHAIKSDYDAVKALLEELFIEYIEK
jgi:hypothetical protein